MRSPLLPSLALVSLLSSVASAQPKIDLPPDDPSSSTAPTPTAPRAPEFGMSRESQIDVPLFGAQSAAATSIGGYGELTLDAPLDVPSSAKAPGGSSPVADVRRIVLYFGHNFTDRLRFYSELEYEHAVTSSTDQGEAEIEQAFLDWLAWRPYFNVRAGLILMPVGIVNQYHEPPMFDGVDRPWTDQLVVPSTWRELGVGVFGGAGPLRWQAYLVTGFQALGFSSDLGLREGHQEGQLARAKDWAGVVRLDWEPRLGIDVGGSFYHGDSGQGLVPSPTTVTLVEADARARWKGLSARAEVASVWIDDAYALDMVLAQKSDAGAQPVASRLWGGYVELAYDVLHPLGARNRGVALDVFGRYEHVDTQAAVPLGFTADRALDRDIVTAGTVLRPIPTIAVKLDYQRWRDGNDAQWNQVNAGLGFMY